MSLPDTTPPTVTGIGPDLNAESYLPCAGATTIGVTFSEPVTGAENASSYRLVKAGADELLGTDDDVSVPVSPQYNSATNTVTLSVPPLAEDVYRLTVRDKIADLPAHFGPAASYRSGGNDPTDVATGDFNRDGRLDLAVVDRDKNLVGILLGSGSGAFSAPTTFAAGGVRPNSLIAGDFSGDGILDLATVNLSTNDVSVLLGNGSGGFAAATTYACGGSTPISLAAADFNGDGRLDIAIAHSGGVGVLLGAESGGLAPVTTFATGGSSPYHVAAADFNRDGRVDLAAANRSSNNIGILLGNGAGGFETATAYAAGLTSPYRIATGDINEDGLVDLAVTGSNQVAVLLGNGAGGLGTATAYSSGGTSAYDLACADFNLDGHLDLAVTNIQSANVAVLAGRGTGEFGSPASFALGGWTVMGLATGDFNGDGQLDLAATNGGNVAVSVLLAAGALGRQNALDGDGDGTPGGDYYRDFVAVGRGGSLTTLSTSLYSPGWSATGDFNSDGRMDLAVADVSSWSKVAVFLGNSSGGFQSPTTMPSGGSMPTSLVAEDFNGDGHLDLAVLHSISGNALTIRLGNGAGGFGDLTAFGYAGYSLVAADFNEDGRIDLACVNSHPHNVYVMLGNGLGGFGAASPFYSGGGTPHELAVGDFNLDGHQDLAVLNFYGNNAGVLLGNGAGGFGPVTTVAVGANPLSIATADFDGDGDLDLAVTHSQTQVAVLTGNGTGGFSVAKNLPSGGSSSWQASVRAADLNADGKIDLAVTNRNSSQVAILVGDGAGGFAAPTFLSAGGPPQSLHVADINGDSQLDVVAANSNGLVGILSGPFLVSPVALTSTGGQRFLVQIGGPGTGQLIDDAGNLFEGVGRLQVGGSEYSPGLRAQNSTDGGRTVITPSQTLGGLTVFREVTVPDQGSQDFARTVDVLFNPTDSPLTTTVRIVGNMGSDAATIVWNTSDGDTEIETTDQWIGTDDADGTGTPAVVHYIHGVRGLAPASVLRSGDNIEWTYNVTVPAGQTVRLAHYRIVGVTRAEAQAAANVLVTANGFGGQAAAYLSESELTALDNFQFNQAPTGMGLSNASVAENQEPGVSVGSLSATDPDLPADTHTYRLVPGVGDTDNAAFTLDPTGVLRTADRFDYETKPMYSIRVRATDRGGLWCESTFAITVTDANDPPTMSAIADQTTGEDTPKGPISFSVGDVETAAASLVVTATSSNEALLSNANLVLGGSGANRTILLTPAANQSGTADVTVSVSDGTAATSKTFLLTVTAENDLPTIGAIADQTTGEDVPKGPISFSVGDVETATASLNVTATSNNQALLPNANLVLGGSGANRTILLTPAANQSGTATVTVTVSDGTAATSRTFLLTVTAENDLPTIGAIADQTTGEDVPKGPISFSVSDVETAAASLVVTATSSNQTLLPNANLVLGGSGANRTILLTPAANQSGNATVTVTVSDGTAATSNAFLLTVTAENDLPTISAIADQTTGEDMPKGPISFSVGDVETAAASLVVTATSSNQALLPNANLVLGGSEANRTILLTPSANQFGTATVTVTVSDGTAVTSKTFVLSVTAENDLPTISAIGDQTTGEDTPTGPISFSVGDVETPAASLVVTAASNNQALLPDANLALGGSGANRTILLTPAANRAGTATVTVTVFDGEGTVSSAFVLNVAAQDDPPIVLAPVDFVPIPEQDLSAGDVWYQFPASRNGWLIVEALREDVELTLFDQSLATLQRSSATEGKQRLQRLVQSGENYFVRLHGTSGIVDLRFANLVEHEGTTVTVYGTSRSDSFRFDATSGYKITINGVDHYFSANEATTFALDGLDGSDDLQFIGTSGPDSATIYPTSGKFSGESYSLAAINIESADYDGAGGQDTVTVLGSPDVNTYTAHPGLGQMTGDGVSILARAETIYARGGGGADLATIWDSPGDDLFEFFSIWARVSGEGYLHNVHGFTTIVGKAALGVNGTDEVIFRGSPQGDWLKSTTTTTRMLTLGAWRNAEGFDTITAYARGGKDKPDTLLVQDTPGADTLKLRPLETTLITPAYKLTGYGFGSVEATRVNVNMAEDTVTLEGSPGDDTLVGNPTAVQITSSNPAYSNKATGFPSVMAYSTGAGVDKAFFSDSSGASDTGGRDDTFTAGSVTAELTGPGYRLWARLFDEVHAEARLGRDIANLTGTAGTEELAGTAAEVSLSGLNAKGTFANSAEGFDEINAFGGAGQDKAVVTDAAVDLVTYGAPVNVPLKESAQFLWLNQFEKIELRKSGTSERTDIDNIDAVLAGWE
ncbi:MAG: VCBS repeat-containing protein [Pirellulales bacterium]|nr:VCBS repeat-containing protein [Pirellulales bacterium]